MTRLITALTLLLFLASCGGLRDSKVNPFNWFGRDHEEKIAAVNTTEAVNPRPLVTSVIKLKADRLPGGAIIQATGLPETQGFWEGELVPLNGELPDKGTLVYEFRIIPPLSAQPSGTQRSREVVIGRFVSDQTLVGVRRIQVIAKSNKRTVRR